MTGRRANAPDAPHRIIEPITSRCSKFRFKPLDTGSTAARLKEICLAEKVDCPEEVRTLETASCAQHNVKEAKGG